MSSASCSCLLSLPFSMQDACDCFVQVLTRLTKVNGHRVPWITGSADTVGHLNWTWLNSDVAHCMVGLCVNITCHCSWITQCVLQLADKRNVYLRLLCHIFPYRGDGVLKESIKCMIHIVLVILDLSHNIWEVNKSGDRYLTFL